MNYQCERCERTGAEEIDFGGLTRDLCEPCYRAAQHSGEVR